MKLKTNYQFYEDKDVINEFSSEEKQEWERKKFELEGEKVRRLVFTT